MLARPYIVPNGIPLTRLVVVGLNSDMCFSSVGVASLQFEGSLEPLFDDILEFLPVEGTKYFAIAYAGSWPAYDFESAQPASADVEQLRKRAEASGLHMIGSFGITEASAMHVDVQSYFDRSGMDLPETMLHWRHSILGNCP